MQSSSEKWFRDSWPQSPSSSHSMMINAASMTREESLPSRLVVRQRNGLSLEGRVHPHNEALSLEYRSNILQPIDAKYGLSVHPKSSEYRFQDVEQLRGRVQQRNKMYHASEYKYQPSTTRHMTSQQPVEKLGGFSFAESRKDAEQPVHSFSSTSRKLAYHPQTASQSVQGPWRDGCEDDVSAQPPGHKKPNLWDAVPTYSALQTAELHKRYEMLSRDYKVVRGELREKLQLLEEKEYRIRSLNTEITGLQRRYEKQSSALVSTRHEYKSCQVQLDNVQRFISTADAHADQDIIQKLQELNEEVYQISMTMADNVAENLGRQNATVPQSKERISIGKFVLGAIGIVMVNHLAVLEGNEDVTLFLQLAFQGYLSHVLCQIISSWSVDQRLNAPIEEMYQRLRKAETQAISGHWRVLTRTHILPTYVSDPKILVENFMTGFSVIVAAAGLVSPQPDAMSKLWSEIGGKISSIVSHAGTFGNMVSGMISGDFEVFAVQPGATFDRESMVDINEDQETPRGKEVTQTVLCVSRVGLRKQMGEKTITLTKARVVLESFLD